MGYYVVDSSYGKTFSAFDFSACLTNPDAEKVRDVLKQKIIEKHCYLLSKYVNSHYEPVSMIFKTDLNINLSAAVNLVGEGFTFILNLDRCFTSVKAASYPAVNIVVNSILLGDPEYNDTRFNITPTFIFRFTVTSLEIEKAIFDKELRENAASRFNFTTNTTERFSKFKEFILNQNNLTSSDDPKGIYINNFPVHILNKLLFLGIDTDIYDYSDFDEEKQSPRLRLRFWYKDEIFYQIDYTVPKTKEDEDALEEKLQGIYNDFEKLFNLIVNPMVTECLSNVIKNQGYGINFDTLFKCSLTPTNTDD